MCKDWNSLSSANASLIFSFQMLSAPLQLPRWDHECLIFLWCRSARTSVKFLGIADLDILIFWDSAFLTYPSSIAFSGNAQLIRQEVRQGYIVAGSMTTGEDVEWGTMARGEKKRNTFGTREEGLFMWIKSNFWLFFGFRQRLQRR